MADSAFALDPVQRRKLAAYSALTGTPIKLAITEALDDYFTVVVPARLEAYQSLTQA